MAQNLLLIGGGGHCRSCLDVISATNIFHVIGILDVEDKVGKSVDGVKIVGTDQQLDRWLTKTDFVFITIGQIGINPLRKKLFTTAIQKGAKFPSIISPRAYLASNTTIAAGTIVMHDALINSGARIAENSIINSKALIEHDVNIGSHCHISTGVIINGGVHIDDNSFVGSNSVVFEGRKIAANCVVAGGSIIKSNIDSQTNT